MPVSNAKVVDAIGVDPLGNYVELSMFEERDWSDQNQQLKDLEAKINCYIGFVVGGQINDNPVYRGKSVSFDMYCQFPPLEKAKNALIAIKDHVAKHKIRFRIFLGANRDNPLAL